MLCPLLLDYWLLDHSQFNLIKSTVHADRQRLGQPKACLSTIKRLIRFALLVYEVAGSQFIDNEDRYCEDNNKNEMIFNNSNSFLK